MKKMLRIAAALAALLAMTNFIGCKNDDDDDGDETVAVTEVKITSTVKEVTAGETITLEATVSPENATSNTVTWTSDNNEVATVKDGVVTGVKAGEATITASAGGKTATVKVTVKAAATSGGETGGSGSGETGGSTGGTTGGTTGGSTGGTTGGETGTTTGFENTYWVLEKTSFEESGLKVTLENLEYIYIKDSTSGSSYAANPEGVIKGLSESSVGTHNLDYEEPITFTYTVDGSNVTIKMGEETINAVIAADKNSFTITDGSETHEYTKVAAAPTEATVTVEVTAAPSTKLNVSMDVATLVFADVTEGLTDTYAGNANKNGTYMIPASTTILGALKPAKDDKAYWYTDKARSKIAALQLNGEGALNFTLSGAATVKVTFLSTGDSNTSAITVNGTANSVTGKTATEFTWEISDAGDYSILSSGVSNARITKLSIIEK